MDVLLECASYKPSLQFSSNFVVINASEGSLCFQNFRKILGQCNFSIVISKIIKRFIKRGYDPTNLKFWKQSDPSEALITLK
jgi:hypothetical protein